MWQNQLIVLDKIGKSLLIAIAGILNGEIYEKIEKSTGSQLCLYVSTAAQVAAALQKHVPMKAPAPPAPVKGNTAARAASAAKPSGPK